MEKKNLLALKENQVLQKKIIQNLQVLQIIQSILEKNLQKTHLQKMKKKALDLKVRKNLKVETVDLKTLHLKNIVKRELVPKIFSFFFFCFLFSLRLNFGLVFSFF